MTGADGRGGEAPIKSFLVFDTPREPYTAGATVVACFDARFDLALRKVLKRLGASNPDLIRVAGGPRTLASGTPLERVVVLDQIRASRRLHGAPRIVLVGHSDCGAYGGLAGAFGGDAGREGAILRQELSQAASVLRAAEPAVEITTCFLDFERAWLDAPGPQAVR